MREEAGIHVYLRGDWQQRVRLASGLVLFAFAAAHFLNHAAGLISIEAMHLAQSWRMAVTRSWLGTTVLGAAFLAHIGLALWKLAQRRTLRMPLWEALQILIALIIPLLLLPHVVDTRVGDWGYGIGINYLYELFHLWPHKATASIGLLLLVWAHSCLGLHYWLRLAPGYTRVAPYLVAPAIAVPALAIAGFVVAGEQVVEILSDPGQLAAFKEQVRYPNAADQAALQLLRVRITYVFLGCLALVVLVHAHRRRKASAAPDIATNAALSPPPVVISYVDGPSHIAEPGMTLLEVSRQNGIPHASVCGGRARCATCLVQVVETFIGVPRPEAAEAALLAATDACSDFRLACQLRPTGPLTVRVLVRPQELAPIPVEFTEVKEVAAVHMRAILANEPVDMDAADRLQLERWLDGRIAYKVATGDLTVEGFPMLGARIEYLNNRPALALAYQGGQHPVTLFVLPMSGAHAMAVSGQNKGCHVLGWSDRHYAYFAASQASRADLERFETVIDERARARGQSNYVTTGLLNAAEPLAPAEEPAGDLHGRYETTDTRRSV